MCWRHGLHVESYGRGVISIKKPGGPSGTKRPVAGPRSNKRPFLAGQTVLPPIPPVAKNGHQPRGNKHPAASQPLSGICRCDHFRSAILICQSSQRTRFHGKAGSPTGQTISRHPRKIVMSRGRFAGSQPELNHHHLPARALAGPPSIGQPPFGANSWGAVVLTRRRTRGFSRCR